jgi:hypothetical protein
LLLFFVGTGDFTQGFMLAKLSLYCVSHTCSPFCSGYFGDEVSRASFLGWPQTTILLILVSQVARITGMSYQCLATVSIFIHHG